MSSMGAADEWDVVVPADAEQLMAELRRHGVHPGQRLHVIASQDVDSTGETWPPPWVGSFDSDEPNLAERVPHQAARPRSAPHRPTSL